MTECIHKFKRMHIYTSGFYMIWYPQDHIPKTKPYSKINILTQTHACIQYTLQCVQFIAHEQFVTPIPDARCMPPHNWPQPLAITQSFVKADWILTLAAACDRSRLLSTRWNNVRQLGWRWRLVGRQRQRMNIVRSVGIETVSDARMRSMAKPHSSPL